jgi:hypothetical protein
VRTTTLTAMLLAGHTPVVWGKDERETHAIFCGNCQETLSIAEYLGCGNSCPRCRAAFNPCCADHYRLYFEAVASASDGTFGGRLRSSASSSEMNTLNEHRNCRQNHVRAKP